MTSNRREPRRLIARDDLEGDQAKVAALLAQVPPTRSSANARARVWARLNRSRPSKSVYLIAAVSGASLAVAAGLFLRALEPELIEHISGDVTVAKTTAQGRRITSTGDARLAVGELVMLELSPHTELIARASEDQVAIELFAGAITAIPLHGETPRLSIASRPYTIEGEGVRTRVVRIDRGEVQIEVFSGEALLSTPTGKRRLHAGDKFESRDEVAAVEPPAPPVESVDPIDPPAPQPRSRKAPRARAKQRIEEPVAKIELEPKVEPDITPAIPAQEDWAALYKQAREERDPGRAIPMFDRLAESGSAFAEVSAFQAARLTMKRGSCPQAVDRFMLLMGGSFDAEARLDVIECQLAMGDLVAAQRSLDHFLRIHPKSEREADLRFLRAELMRKRDRCSDAIPDYESAHDSRHGDDALYFTAWCKLHLGRTEEGLSALRTYLDRFPAGRHAGEAKKKL
jgi:hypothetical protein